MKKSAVLMCGLLAGISAEAANITWVSFHSGANDAPTTAAAGLGFTQAPDVGYTDLLRNAGHNVTRYLTTGTPDTALLNASDLVIISRSVPSGNYDSAAQANAWNGITAPMMILGGYIVRDNRLGFANGNTIPDTANPIRLTINDPNHPVFAGIALDGANTMVDTYGNIVTASINGTPTTQRGISVVTGAMDGGTILATVGTAGDPAVGGMIIGEWASGSQVTGDANAFTSTLGGDRLVFLTGSREHGAAPTSSEIAGIYDLTPTGAQMFLNAVDYMAIPEPSTYALLGLGAAALLMRRKKS